jgi:hypothetical protein
LAVCVAVLGFPSEGRIRAQVLRRYGCLNGVVAYFLCVP